MKVLSNLQTSANRDCTPQGIILDSDRALNIKSEIVLLSTTKELTLTTNPLFVYSNGFDTNKESRFLKIANVGNFNVIFSASLINLSQDLVLSPKYVADFIFVPQLGWLYQKSPLPVLVETDKPDTKLVSIDLLVKYDFVNIFVENGVEYCRLADRRNGASRSADGFVLNGCDAGNFASIYKSGRVMSGSDLNLSLNQSYYLGIEGKISTSILNINDPDNFGYLIQKVGRAINKHSLAFDPQFIAVNKTTIYV